MKLDWTSGVPRPVPLPGSGGPDFYSADSGIFELWVERLQEYPAGRRWIWMLDGPGDDGFVKTLAVGVEDGADAAFQAAERAVFLREHGVTSDVTERIRDDDQTKSVFLTCPDGQPLTLPALLEACISAEESGATISPADASAALARLVAHAYGSVTYGDQETLSSIITSAAEESPLNYAVVDSALRYLAVASVKFDD